MLKINLESQEKLEAEKSLITDLYNLRGIIRETKIFSKLSETIKALSGSQLSNPHMMNEITSFVKVVENVLSYLLTIEDLHYKFIQMKQDELQSLKEIDKLRKNLIGINHDEEKLHYDVDEFCKDHFMNLITQMNLEDFTKMFTSFQTTSPKAHAYARMFKNIYQLSSTKVDNNKLNEFMSRIRDVKNS